MPPKARLKRFVFLLNINVSKSLYGFVYGEKIDTPSFKNIENETDYAIPTYICFYFLNKNEVWTFFDINAPNFLF